MSRFQEDAWALLLVLAVGTFIVQSVCGVYL